MKHLIKRWLAMFLAVLMVVGTLPTSALAAHIMDDEPLPAAPVLDQDDPVVDTLSRPITDDDERPDKPVDPDPVPADQTWTKTKSITPVVNDDGSWTVTVTTDDAVGTIGSWGIAIVPDYALGTGTDSPSKLWTDNKVNKDTVTAYTSFDTVFGVDRTGLPASAITVVGNTTGNDYTAVSNTFTIKSSDTGCKNLPDLDTLRTTLGVTGAVNLRVFFYAQSAADDNSKVVTATAKYGGGSSIPDATYVLNLNDNSVKLMGSDGSLTDDPAASFSPLVTGGTLTLPLKSTSGTLYVGLDNTSGYQDNMSISDDSLAGVTDTGTLTVGTAGSNLTVNVKTNDAGAFTINVPYYSDTAGDGNMADTAATATATITVLVINSANVLVPNPIRFEVTEDYAEESKAMTFPSSADIAGTSTTYGALYFTNNSSTTEVGATPPTVDHLTVSYGTAQIRSGGGTGTTASAYRGLLKGTGAGVQTNEKHTTRFGTYGTPKPEVTLQTGLTVGTYSRMVPLGKLTIWTSGTTIKALGDVTVPVTIVVKPKEEPPAETYTVKYDFNGHGDDGRSDTTENVGTATTLADPATVSDLTFAGWYTDETGWSDSNKVTSVSGSENEEITVHARWQYVVTYNYNGHGSGDANSGATDIGTGVTLPTPTEDGYKFNGWYDAASSGNKVGDGGATYTPNANKTVYAQWTEVFKVTYKNADSSKPQISSLPTDTTEYEPNANVTVSSSPAANSEGKVGNLCFKFVGWSDDTTTHTPGTTFQIKADTTLTAVWDVVEITVSLNNKGHGTIPSGWPQSIQKGGSTTLPTLSENGYTFVGWTKTEDNTTADVEGGNSTGSLTTDTTYYAIWTQNATKAIFDLNYVGAPANKESTGVAGTDVPDEKIPSTTRTGWRFDGWYDAASDGNKVTTPKYPPVGTASVTYYAHWTQLFSITYVTAHGTTPNKVENIPAGDKKQTAAAIAEVSDGYITSGGHTYRFDGWKDSDNTVYDAGDGIEATDGISKNHTLTAQWTEVFQVTYDNAASTYPQITTLPTDDTKYVSNAPVTVDGTLAKGTEDTNSSNLYYKFVGWSDSTTTYDPGATFNITSDTTLTAVWEVVNITVTLDKKGHGETGWTGDKQDIQKGATTTLPTLSATGYAFGGWAATDGGAQAVAGGGTTEALTADTTYYAIWTINKYKVTWNANDGKWSDNATTKETTDVAYDTVILEISDKPTKDYSTFDGWYTDATNGTKVTFTGSAPKMPDDDVTYYAHWTANKFSVKYHYENAPTGVTPPSTETGIVAGSGNHTLAAKPSQAGWTFAGWKEGTDSAPGAGSDVTVISKARNNGDVVHVWGTWTRQQSKIKFVYDNNDSKEETKTGNTGEELASGDFPADAGTKTNYRFDKWVGSDTKEYKSDSLPKFPATENETLTITAQWVGQASVVFNVNGGTWTSGDQTQKGDVGTAVTMPGEPTRTGYTFAGWNTDNAATSGDKNDIKFPTNPGDTETYYAIWMQNPATVTVTVKLDGTASSRPVTGAVQLSTSDSSLTGDAVPLTGIGGVYTNNSVPTVAGGAKTYYVFVNGGYVNQSVEVNPGGTGTATVQYWTVEYKDPDGHKSSTATLPIDDIVLDGGTHKVKDGVAGATGYKFKTWNDGTDRAKDDTLTINKKTTLNAVWEVVNYTVTFNKQGHGTETCNDITKQVGTAVGTLPTLTETGYTFGGWYAEEDCTNERTAAFVGDTETTYTFYAKWTPIEYTVTFNKNTSASDSTVVKTWKRDYDTTVLGTETALPTTTQDYYTFKGWFTERSGGTQINGSEKVTGDVTYYAQWEQNKATVTVTVKVDGTAAYPDKDVSITVNGEIKTVESTTSGFQVEFEVPAQAAGYPVTVTGAPASWNANVYAPSGEGRPANVDVNFYTLTLASTPADASATLTPASAGKYMTGTSVNINAVAGDSNYEFTKWTTTGDAAAAPTTASTTVTVTQTTTLTANFNKAKYNTKLHVTLDGNNATVDGTDITAVSCDAGTVTGPVDGVWTASGVSGEPHTWTVSTLSGDYTVSTNGDMDAENYKAAELALYSVETKDTAYDTTQATIETNGHAPQVKAIVPLSQAMTLAVTAADGYTHTGWDVATDSVGTLSGDTYTLTTAITATQEITPTFTYQVPVELRYDQPNGDLVADQTVTIDPAIGVTVANKGSDNTGEFVVSGMEPDTTYKVVVNGYESELVLDKNKASTTTAQVVVLRKITAVADPTEAGTPTVNNTTAVYVPNKAVITDSAPTVTVAVPTAKTGYRWKTETGEKLWSVTSGTATITTDTDTSTTITNADGVEADIVLTAAAVKQYTITAATSGAVGNSDATPTIASGVGSVTNKVATIDQDGVVKVTATKDDDQQIKSWAIEGGDDTLYSDADCKTAVDLTTYKETTVYAKATADATVTVTFEDREYPITVTVKKDNAVYEGVKVKLNNGTKDTTVVTTDANGEAKFDVVAGNWTVFANGTDGGTPVTTGKSVTVNSTDGNTTGAAEVNYYTINLTADPAGTSGKENKVNFSGGTAATTAQKIVLATSSVQDIAIAATAHDGTDLHYRFDKWAVAPDGVGSFANNPTTAGETYKLPKEGDLTSSVVATDNQITLTATFKKQFKVTVELADSALSSANFWARVRKSGDNTAWTSTGTYVFVDAETAAEICGGYTPVGSNAIQNSDYYLSDWTIKTDSGAGTFDNAAHADSTAQSATDKGYIIQGGKFTPTEDTTLVLNAWQRPTWTDSWTYDKGTGANTRPTGDKERRTTWTANDAEAPTKVSIKSKSGAATPYTKDLTVTTDYTVSGDDNEFYTVLADALADVPAATYDLEVTYQLGPNDHPNKLTDQPKTTAIEIVVSKRALTEAKIYVEDKNNDSTASPDDMSRDAVIYKSHKDEKIPHGELTYTWYYADVAPTAQSFKETTTGGVTTSAEDNAKAALTGLTGLTEITDGVTQWTDGTNTIATGTVAVTEAMKGKYIFAVVVANGEISEGAVITNSVLVDYDAAITLQKDGAGVTSYDNYKVYLVPKDTTPNFTADLAGQEIVEATHPADGANGLYTTTGSALDANTEYDVYVNDVEDATADNHTYVKADNTCITRANTMKTVDYYSVTLENVTAGDVTHAKDNTSPTAKDVGEEFSAYPSFNAATAYSAIPSGNGALKGSAVTVKANALSGKGVGWEQDYTLTWKNKAGAASDYTVVTSKKQDSTDAVNTGYAYTTNLTEKVSISGNLAQNTYQVVGDVKDVDSNANGGQVASATLTFEKDAGTTYTFTGKLDANNGKHGGKITFTVPRNVTDGVYTLAATPAAGTTMKGYTVPSDSTPPTTVTETIDLEAVVAGTPGDTLNDKFTVFVQTTELTLEVKDNDANTTHVHQGSDTYADKDSNFNATTGRHKETLKFANYDALTKEVILTNLGNTPLKVTPKLEKYTYDGSAWTKVGSFTPAVSGTTITDSLGDSKDITFTNWPDDTVILGTADGDKSHTITVSVPNNLENKDDVKYRLVFESADGRDGVTATGPTLWFELELEVTPVTVSAVTTRHPDDDPKKFTVDTTTIQEDEGTSATTSYDALKKPTSGTAADTVNDDLVYEWYAADWDAKVEFKNGTLVVGTTPLTKLTDGVSDDTLTYELQPAVEGKTLYLLVKGQNNAQGAATTPDVIGELEPPMQMPYVGKITVKENDTVIATNETDSKPDYKVYLWNKANGAFDPTATDKLIEATWVAPVTDAGVTTDGYFKAEGLYAADTETGKNAYTYEVWTNTVKGTVDTFQNSGQTVKEAQREATVVYHSVTLNNTTVSNAPYDANFTANTTLFYKTVDGTTVQKIDLDGFNKPTAKAGELDVATTETNKWVQTGTSVTFAYPAWTKDYDLTWSGGPTGTEKDETKKSEKTHTVNDETTVNTKLALNVYNVEAQVEGSLGKVDYVDMTLVDGEHTYVFTTKTETDKILGVASSWDSGIAVTQKAIFRLPKAEAYTTKATVTDTSVKFTGYTYDGTNYPYDETNHTNETITVKVDGATSYVIHLQGDGLALKVTDDVPTGLQSKATNDPKPAAGSASIVDKTASAAGEAKQEIKLNYNYNQDLTVIVTALNNSKQGETAQVLKNVKFEADSSLDTSKFEVTTNNFSTAKDLGRTGAGTDADPYGGESDTVTVTVKKGLAVGTHTFTGTFTFEDSESPATSATVKYTLTVIVEPLPFTAVTTQKNASNGELSIKDYTVTRKAEGMETDPVDITDTPAASGKDTNTALTADTDYAYQWVRADLGKKPSVTWTNGSISVTEGTAITTNGTSKTYTPVDEDDGKALYLVIYAKQNTNATEYAISEAITMGYNGIVYINVDADRLGTTSGSTDPGYTVKFVHPNDTDKNVTGEWKVATGDKYAYVGENLDPATSYTVQVSRAKDDSTNLVTLDGVTIAGTNIGEETGHTPAFTNVAEASYFTVNAVNLTNEAYQTGTGETFTGNITPAFTIGTDKAELADQTSVLSGQTVTAKIPALASKTVGWEQDYNLTWQAKSGNALADGTMAAGDDKTPANVTAENATQDAGAYSQAITEKTYIGGRLDQNTYTVTGSIQGTGEVAKATLTGGTGNKVYGTEAGTDIINANNKWSDADNNGKHNAGDTVTFTVVKGTYTVTGYEATGTTITKVTVDGGTTGGTARNVNTLTNVDDNTRTFTIHLEAAGPKLGVTDDQTPTPAANTSGTGNADHKHADNAKEYFFNAITTPDHDFVLSLKNPGNVELVLGTPEVYRLDSGTSYTTIDSALLSSDKKLTVDASGALSSGSTNYTAVTVTNLATANTKVAVNAGGGNTGDPNAVAGGTVTVNTAAANNDDAIYVVKFPSTYVELDGTASGTSQTGPTVYYVLDLTVKPLPIVEVAAETDPTKTDGTLRLKDYVAEGGSETANDGLGSVWVDPNADGTLTDKQTAKDANLKDADLSFIWAKAAPGVTVDKTSFELGASGITVKSGVTDVEVLSATNKDYTPTATEQGMNFYLIAYRADETHNATDFAVSAAVYAQVTVSMKAYRTNTDTELTDVKISGTVGEGDDADIQTSNGGTFTVTANGTTIPFTADMTDDKSDPHDPAKAKYYFIEWKAKGEDNTVDTTGVTTPADDDRLKMSYAVTEKATVIGYYDLLPELTGSTGYNMGADAYSSGKNTTAEKAARTLNYKPNDGSEKVEFWVVPAEGSQFKNGEDKTSARKVAKLGAFEEINGGTTDEIGVEGSYVLEKNWISTNLVPGNTYIFTFYDTTKGTKAAADGYAGYDRAIQYTITDGEKYVQATVNTDTPWGTVKITNNATPTGSDGPGEAANLMTYNGAVNLIAAPNDGYAFVGWTKDNPDTDKGSFKDAGKAETEYSGVSMATEYVTATFRKGEFTVNEDAFAKVFYGNNQFEANTATETNGKPITVTGETGVNGQNFSYDLATEAEIKAALSAETLADNVYYKTDDATDAHKSPAWLELKADGTFAVKSGEKATGVNVRKDGNGDDVTDELVVYVKVTETKTNEVKYVPFTVDVMTSPLKIVGGINAAAYVTAYRTGEGKEEIEHFDPVKLDYYTFTKVVNEKNENDVVVTENVVSTPNKASDTYDNGKWSVDPTTFDGSGENEKNAKDYAFTYTYTGVKTGEDEEATYEGPYNYSFATEKLTIAVTKPKQALDFSDIVTPETPAQPEDDTFLVEYENTDVVVYYLDEIPDTYDVYLRNPGSFTLYDVALTEVERTGVWKNGQTDTGEQIIGILDKETGEAAALPTLDELNKDNTKEMAFKADLSKLKFAGTYTLKVHAKGNTVDAGDPNQASLMAENLVAEADYTLIVKIVPRPIVVANVTGLGAAVPGTTVAQNLANLEVKGHSLNSRPQDATNPDVEGKDEDGNQIMLDLINKAGDEEPGVDKGLDVNGRQRLQEKVTWVNTDTSEKLNDGDFFQVETGYGITLILKPDFNYTFIRETEDNFYTDPTDNGNATPTDPTNEKVEGDYKLIVDSGDPTNPKKEYKLDPKETDDPFEPDSGNKAIIIEEEQTGKIATLMFDDAKQDDKGDPTTDVTGPQVDDKRTISVNVGSKLGKYTVNLGAYLDPSEKVKYLNVTEDLTGMPAQKKEVAVLGEDGKPVLKEDGTEEKEEVTVWSLTPAIGDYNSQELSDATDAAKKVSWELDLSGIDTSVAGSHKLVFTAKGIHEKGLKSELLTSTYTLIINITKPGGGGGGGGGEEPCPCKVFYYVGIHGTTTDPTLEDVTQGGHPSKVPTVKPLPGYEFKGWTQVEPAKWKNGEIPELVEPKNVTAGKDPLTFYAVIVEVEERPFHEHYVIGYPNGNFGPADNIDRGSVATIIARAILPGFVEGANYGNPGGYSDVSGHWAESAIAYCSKYGVFKGYLDGTFKPSQPITRQEFATVIARLDGVMEPGEMSFTDIDEAGPWALGGIYTAYAKGWVNGYTDGTFKPLNNIRRDEAVKIFNAYLNRGVDAEGLSGLKEYVHSGVASNNTENGTDEYMTWPDVPKGHWAYYEIIEAANDHEYLPDAEAELGYTLPEKWEKCWIDERWRYHDDLTDGGPATGLVSAGFRVWLH